MSEYFGPLMRSSRAREQRANERFLPLSRERSFRWFHEALVFETSLRPLPPLMFVGFSHCFLPCFERRYFEGPIGSLLRRSIEFPIIHEALFRVALRLYLSNSLAVTDSGKCRYFMIALVPQTAQHHRSANGLAALGPQSQLVSGCFGMASPFGLIGSVRLGVGRPNHLAPFLGISDKELPELGRSADERCTT
jgi:hypothetical protein